MKHNRFWFQSFKFLMYSAFLIIGHKAIFVQRFHSSQCLLQNQKKKKKETKKKKSGRQQNKLREVTQPS